MRALVPLEQVRAPLVLVPLVLVLVLVPLAQVRAPGFEGFGQAGLVGLCSE